MFLVHFRGPAGPRRPPARYGNYGPRGNYDPPTSIQAFTVTWHKIAQMLHQRATKSKGSATDPYGMRGYER